MTVHPLPRASRPAPRPPADPRLPATSRPLDDFECDVLRLAPALRAFAHRLHRQEADAEDLVQDTVLKALRARARFQPGTNLKGWLFTIMRNTFNTRWRRASRETVPGAEAMEADAARPATQGADLWTREAIARLLHDISPAHREVLILVPVLGLGYDEAATVCGCSVGTIKSRLNRARLALATLVDGVEP